MENDACVLFVANEREREFLVRHATVEVYVIVYSFGELHITPLRAGALTVACYVQLRKLSGIDIREKRADQF